MVDKANPFSLVRASDITDAQINSLWVELGAAIINAVMEPTSPISKYILGGKGTGKTHLLRYHSYQVARLRRPNLSGVDSVKEMGYLAVFLRATALDSARFEMPGEPPVKWQTLFGVYLELKLTELVLDALSEIKKTSPDVFFDEISFLRCLNESVGNPGVTQCQSIEELRAWIEGERRSIDQAVNNAAFSGALDIRAPFGVGALCLPLKRAMCALSDDFKDIPLIYMLDEIENFSTSQQVVVNSLIRYGEGLATFRVSGRLYARRTTVTIGGEENREGSEFKTVRLDDMLTKNIKFGQFARKFVQNRLGFGRRVGRNIGQFEPSNCLQEIDSSDFYEASFSKVGIDPTDRVFIKNFEDMLKSYFILQKWDIGLVSEIVDLLVSGHPLILQKLNILLFCKKFKAAVAPLEMAKEISRQAKEFVLRAPRGKSGYANAYGHYKLDLFAQLCRESKKSLGVPYAGFDTFIGMACGNPRNLLISLGRIYEISAFKELDFVSGPPADIALQTTAAAEAARFMFERDTNYGAPSDVARRAIERLASLLRTARFAVKIPEVSPLTVSFSDEDLNSESRKALDLALKYSFLFEVDEGRPDRNSDRVNRKVQLNPMLSPRWQLPIARRGDISLSSELVNSIFDGEKVAEFEVLLRGLANKWNNPFFQSNFSSQQKDLFS
ncbi:hypothetical protein ACFPTX_02050 [Pseudomonas sp. GCM10022188]|uniref:ORC-CDC6 family AAA ATPase n=1 Tax=Pseudomonas TaxID=286 RepID=UPI001E4789FF|nr:hypothetical protein [Pseudomonas oryzagri]MCC6076491.1 hypothetical protein [Pseudomonas oryzagri]